MTEIIDYDYDYIVSLWRITITIIFQDYDYDYDSIEGLRLRLQLFLKIMITIMITISNQGWCTVRHVLKENEITGIMYCECLDEEQEPGFNISMFIPYIHVYDKWQRFISDGYFKLGQK